LILVGVPKSDVALRLRYEHLVSQVGILRIVAKDVTSFTFIGGGAGKMSRRDRVFRVVNHGTYHRGNITGMMWECFLEPPTTDYPVFLKQHSLNKHR